MRNRPSVRAGCVVVFAATLCGQRLPLPSASERASAHDAFLDALVRLAPDVDAVLRAAADPKLPAAARWELIAYAERAARAAGDVGAGLRSADALAATFAVSGETARADCLERFEAAGVVAAPALAGARLVEAERLLASDDVSFAAHVRRACELARGQHADVQAHVEWEAQALSAARAQFAAMGGTGADAAARARFLAFYRGEFEQALTAMRAGDDRAARVADSKVRARSQPPDFAAASRHAEEWLALSRQQEHTLARRHLCLRARRLLAPLLLPAQGHDGDGNDAGETPDPAVLQRLRKVFDRAGDLARETFAPAASQWRFGAAADRAQLLITGGEWCVRDGVLVGHNDGAATRATARLAWRRIECVTVRGGIRSPSGLNFRVAVGDCNLLLNWEVRDENHLFFRDRTLAVGPRRLRPGQEHEIRVQQVGEHIAVSVDGEVLATIVGTLAGTVSVYPALGSTIFVRSLDVLGELDLGQTVTGPTGEAR